MRIRALVLAISVGFVTVLALATGSALAATPEKPEALAPSPLFATTATLRGVLNPKATVAPSEAGTYQFVYRPSSKKECKGAGEIKAPASPGIPAGQPAEPVSEPVTGLVANTEYAVCLVAEDGAGATASTPVSFKTGVAALPETPEVTVPTGELSTNAATFHGLLDPNAKAPSEAGTYEFLYKATNTATIAECESAGAIRAPTSPAAYAGAEHEEVPAEPVGGLVANTEYVVCLSATNGSGTTISAPVSFTTPAATKPAIETQSASEPTKGTVNFSATINPNGAATTCELKYGKTAALEATPVACPAELAAGSTGQSVAVELKGLEPKTEYHFEFVATNEKGTNPAATQSVFTTGPKPPQVITGLPAKVKRANAILDAEEAYVIPYAQEETVYYAEYDTALCEPVAGTCGTKTPVRGPVTGTLNQAEPQKVTRLKPGTTYHYWLVASGPGGTAHGEEMTFTTATAEPKEYVYEQELAASSPVGIGVNQANGDTYFANDAGGKPPTIEQLNAKNELASSVPIPGNGNNTIYQIAVDNSGIPGQQGDVYAADPTVNVVYKFVPNSEGKLELDKETPKIGEGSLSEPRGVAVDSSGNVYVASTTSGSATVSEFSSTGTHIHENLITGLNAPSGLAFGLAVDASGNIYLTCANGTAEYTPTGTCAEPGTSPEKCKLINGEPDDAVVLDAAGDVFISVVSPAAVREYGPTENHPPIPNPALEAFSKYPLGIAVNDTSRALYVSENGRAVKIFRFLDVKPVVVKTETATAINGPIEALQGTIIPGGQEPAEYYFEYGTSPCDRVAETCGTVATEPSQVPLYGVEEIHVSVRLDNLAPNTTYHYWIVGANEESGVEHGEEQTFTTGSPTPSLPALAPEGAAPESKTPASTPEYPLLTGIAPVPIKKAPVVKTLTRAQHLAKALAACNRKPKKQRAACKSQARKKYGPVTKKKKKKK